MTSLGSSDFVMIPAVQWTQTYGGPGSEQASSVLQTADGGFLLVGSTDSFGAGGLDMWAVKTNSRGVAQWNETYGGSGFAGRGLDGALSALQTRDGGFLLAGYTRSYGAGNIDMWAVKTDSRGRLQWSQPYGGLASEHASSVLQTIDGGFLLVGSTISFGAGETDMWAVKTDSQGVAQWNQTYGGPNYDWGFSVLLTTDGGFLLAGSTGSYEPAGMWLVKTDSEGVVQWNQTYGGPVFDYPSSVLPTADGGFLIVGSRMGELLTTDMWVVKTDSQGVAQWNQTYGGADDDRASSVLPTADGGFLLTGSTSSYGAGGDMWLVKIDGEGMAQWNQTYGGSNYDGALSILQTTDGGLLLAGFQYDEAGNEDMYLVKLHTAIDPNGKGDFFSSSEVIIGLTLWILACSFSLILASWFIRRKSRLKQKNSPNNVRKSKLEP